MENQKLERSMIGPKGQINNLDTNDVALSFMTLQMLDEKDLRHGCLENIKRRLEVSKAKSQAAYCSYPSHDDLFIMAETRSSYKFDSG